MPTLRIPTPADFDLPRDCCSYGYFLLAPNHWVVKDRALVRPLRLSSGVVGVRLTQPGGTGTPLRADLTRTLDAGGRRELLAQVTRMLRLDEDEHTIRAFHDLDPRWRASGRGRLFRSPTLFEDVVKTVTSCNVTWPGTVQMNRRLCEVLGEVLDDPGASGTDARAVARTFPEARRLARARVQTLRARCRVGYRDARLVELARLFTTPRAKGGVDPAWFEDPRTPDDALHAALLALPGVGPYAAANIFQLLGRYNRLPLDTESVRHGRTVLGFGGTPAQVMRRVQAHFAPFGAQAFRSYWFEMWETYEARHGKAWTWERDSTGKLFTAAHLNATNPPKADEKSGDARGSARGSSRRPAARTKKETGRA